MGIPSRSGSWAHADPDPSASARGRAQPSLWSRRPRRVGRGEGEGRRASGCLGVRPRVAGAVGGGRGPRGRAHISAKFPDGRSLPARSAFPARPGSALRTQREVSLKKMPRAPRGRRAVRSRRRVREPRPTTRGASRVHGVGVRTGRMSGPRPRSRGQRSPFRPAVQPVREEGAAAAAARDAALPAERCGAAPTQGRGGPDRCNHRLWVMPGSRICNSNSTEGG